MTLFPRLLRLWLGTCLRSTRWQVSGSPAPSKPDNPGAGYGRRLLAPLADTQLGPVVLGADAGTPPGTAGPDFRNPDGMLIADVVRPWGIIGIHGSSSKRARTRVARPFCARR